MNDDLIEAYLDLKLQLRQLNDELAEIEPEVWRQVKLPSPGTRRHGSALG